MDGKLNARFVEELETATHSNNSTRDSGGFVDYLHYTDKYQSRSSLEVYKLYTHRSE